jgi:hypothetical protein
MNSQPFRRTKRSAGRLGRTLDSSSSLTAALGAVINGPTRDTHQINSYFLNEPFDPRSLRSLEKALGKKASKANIKRFGPPFSMRKIPRLWDGNPSDGFCLSHGSLLVGEPIKIGNVMIHDRDFIVADHDGQS